MYDRLWASSSPHIRDGITTRQIMFKVLLALLPATVASILIFGIDAAILICVTVSASVAFEAIWAIVMKKPQTIGDLSAVVTGVLLAFNFPSTLPIWMAIIGSFVAIIIVKMLFGGIGTNFANPAIVGRMVLALSFTSAMTNYPYVPSVTSVEALAGATPFVAAETVSVQYLDLLIGTHSGVLGETSTIALLMGGIYLIMSRVISPAIPLSYILVVLAFPFITGDSTSATQLFGNVVLEFAGGGLMLGAFFMATDYTTSPYTLKGKIIYGIGLGLITGLIRNYGNMTEGVSYAIMVMNILVPFINKLTRQRVLGGKGFAKFKK